MAQCTKCGAIMHADDATKHVCKTENLPIKGEELKPTFTKVAI